MQTKQKKVIIYRKVEFIYKQLFLMTKKLLTYDKFGIRSIKSLLHQYYEYVGGAYESDMKRSKEYVTLL